MYMFIWKNIYFVLLLENLNRLFFTQKEYQSYVLLVIWFWEKASPVLKVAITSVSQMPHQPLTLSRAAALMFIIVSSLFSVLLYSSSLVF